jgi:hypothetical protein
MFILNLTNKFEKDFKWVNKKAINVFLLISRFLVVGRSVYGAKGLNKK